MTEREKRKKKREETDRERNHEWVREIEREGKVQHPDGIKPMTCGVLLRRDLLYRCATTPTQGPAQVLTCRMVLMLW